MLINSNGVGNLKVAMGRAIKTRCISSAGKLLRWGFADWANEGHGQRLAALHTNVDPLQVSASIFDLDQGTLGLEGFSYGSTVVLSGVVSSKT